MSGSPNPSERCSDTSAPQPPSSASTSGRGTVAVESVTGNPAARASRSSSRVGASAPWLTLSRRCSGVRLSSTARAKAARRPAGFLRSGTLRASKVQKKRKASCGTFQSRRAIGFAARRGSPGGTRRARAVASGGEGAGRAGGGGEAEGEVGELPEPVADAVAAGGDPVRQRAAHHLHHVGVDVQQVDLVGRALPPLGDDAGAVAQRLRRLRLGEAPHGVRY